LIVDGVSIGQHALMQDASNQNARALPAVEQYMLAMLQTTQTGANVVTEPAQGRIVSKHLATNLKLAEVTGGLGFAPRAKGVIGDAQQVGLSATRKSKRSHG
jgi:hypothetical protein